MKRTIFAACAWLGAMASPAVHAEDLSLGGQQWTTRGDASKVTFEGREALYLKNAIADLKDVTFETGTIEFDIAFQEERGFVGIHFRAQDGGNYEHFYFRPHLSGMPDANQYTPVFNGNTGWQIYFGPEYSAPKPYKFGEWMHVRMEIAADKADIYIDSDTPSLHVWDLKREAKSGGIAFAAFNTGAYYANLKVTPGAGQVIEKEVEKAVLPKGLVTEWEVSPPLSYAALTSAATLNDALPGAIKWKTLTVETNGVANLGRLASRSDEADAVLARLTITSDTARQQLLKFGYSDEVRVFVNGVPVYDGTNFFRSRDYRYLGTVGLFDGLILPLKKGTNEVVFAVREQFGGWAVMGQLVE